jgi:hypothetical protein
MFGRSSRWSKASFFILPCVVCICCAAGPREAFSQMDAPSENRADAPSMVIQETKFDFGEVDEASLVSHDFIVKNLGNAELQINKVSPD